MEKKNPARPYEHLSDKGLYEEIERLRKEIGGSESPPDEPSDSEKARRTRPPARRRER